MTKYQEFRKQTEEAKFEAFSLMCKKVAELEEAKANLEYLLEGRDNEIDELKKENKVLAQNLEDTEICENGWKNRVKELEAQIEKMKCPWNCKKFSNCKLSICPCDKWEIKEND